MFGKAVRARLWNREFREMIPKATIYNTEKSVKSTVYGD